MILYIFGYGDFKNVFFQNFLPFFGKVKILNFFSRNYFSIKITENLSTYSNYECLQLKSTKSAINASVNSAKKIKFVQSPRGKLTLGPPLKNSQQRSNDRRHFLCLVVIILITYGGKQINVSHVCQPISAPLL